MNIKNYKQFINENTTQKYYIEYGVGGGINSKNSEVIDAKSEDDASTYAWQMACQDYDNYAGMNGIRDVSDIVEEDEVDEEEAQMIFNEERESWLDYSAEIYNPEKHDELL